MYEVIDNRTNKKVFEHQDRSVCDDWIYDMNDLKDYLFLYIRKAVNQTI